MSSSRSNEYRPPRKVEYFETPQEILGAVYDAILDHQKVWETSGTIHSNVNPDILYLGCSSPTSRERGFLKATKNQTFKNPMFQSVMALSNSILGRQTYPLDYLDDLESFYYIIAWFSMAYTGPGKRRPRSDLPDVLACWTSDPFSREAVLEKEAMLFGGGFGFGNVCSFFGGYTMERLLQGLHSILRGRYLEKLAFGRVMTWEEMNMAAQVAYTDFLWELQVTMKMLDGMDSNKRSLSLIVSHGGLFPEDLDVLVERYKAMGYEFEEEEDW
ncbi:hypothetical protein GALMADRAFT_229701 [Galerina marginata CBS 339.88]|uniref:Fungal-type protein kinase domain-containing protein n=1 Tax=Galerina marginata (strain CBS 339.88) TaxID=685588 RepID=A0A067SWA5_GALM3|nr:hypothetical protein GALMADRAFT_229701 [Galerina marginata CBS 339.88]